MAGQVASGVAAIHSHDLVHLDLHPGNIFIDGVLAAQACLCHMGPMGLEIVAQEICPPVRGVYCIIITAREFYLVVRSILTLFLLD